MEISEKQDMGRGFRRWMFCGALIDMDGVLYDSMPGHCRAWHRTMREELGIEIPEEEFYLYEGMTGEATIEMLAERELGKTFGRERVKELYDIKTRHFRTFGEAALMPGAARMLAALERLGMKRVLVTGSGQKSLIGALERDYPGVFPYGCRVTALDVVRGKPAPDPYLKGAALAGAEPRYCMVVENAPLGVRAGKAAGCFTVAVTTGPIPREAFEREGADMIFGSMDEFADFLERCVWEDKVVSAIRGEGYDKVFVLTDRNVEESVIGIGPGFLERELDARRIVVDAGEGSKNADNLLRIWRELSEGGATRHSLLVNIGGGVVCDLGGFAGATFKRGIGVVNVPTTVLAQADAAIGGKTGIDFNGLKNEVGVFAMPRRVVSDPWPLRSLPMRERVAGFAEVVKMALLGDGKMWEEILECDSLEVDVKLGEWSAEAGRMKEAIVREDPRELGNRVWLNLGHTAAHAYESMAAAKGLDLNHGEAVAHGLLYALEKSVELAGLDRRVADAYRERVLERWFPPLPFEADEEEMQRFMSHDKKNRGMGKVRMVLLRGVGEPVVVDRL